MTSAPPASANDAECSNCQARVSPDTRVCPRCAAPLLFDVHVIAAESDGRRRYRIARELCEAVPGLDFATVQNGLKSAHGVVAYELGASAAERTSSHLGSQGIACGSAPSRARPEPAFRLSFNAVLAIGALISIALIGAAATYRFSASSGDSELLEGDVADGRPSEDEVAPAPEAEEGPVPSAREVADRVVPSTAAVRCGRSAGAGFFVDSSLLVTNAHVLCDGGPLTVELSGGERLDASVVRKDEDLDIALLRVPGARATPLALADASTLRRGEKVYAVGSPHGLAFTLSDGIVSHHARMLLGKVYVQVDASINAGNSGGPLLDERGRVIGVVSMRVRDSSGLGLALASNHLFADGGFGLTAPSGWDPGAWTNLVSDADQQARVERAEAREMVQRPILIDARGDARKVRAFIVQLREYPPASVRFRAENRDTREECSFHGEVDRWTRVDSESERGPRVPDRIRAYLEQDGHLDAAHVGVVTADWSACNAPVGGRMVLTLEEAPAQFGRTLLFVESEIDPHPISFHR